jgi:RNA ligase
MFNLPSREQCQIIINNCKSFIVKEVIIENQNVEIYNYRLATLSDFRDNDAFELRGLTFVKSGSGEWVKHILMNKFFNINQTDGWHYNDVKDKKLVRIQNKEDGSIISFVKFKNGKVRAKSKMFFDSNQAQMAQKIYDTDLKLQSTIKTMMSANYTPIYELVSPENQIILEYKKTKLVLLQIRNNLSGKYVPFSKFNITDDVAEDFDPTKFTLDDLLKAKEKNKSNIEGWVVTFDDGQMAKIKTDKYLAMHRLIGSNICRENLLVKTILDGDIDDVIASLVPGEKKNKIIEIEKQVVNNFNLLVIEFNKLRKKYYEKFKEDRKKFSFEYKKVPLFSVFMKNIFTKSPRTVDDIIKEYIQHKCNTLNSARKYLLSL